MNSEEENEFRRYPLLVDSVTHRHCCCRWFHRPLSLPLIPPPTVVVATAHRCYLYRHHCCCCSSCSAAYLLSPTLFLVVYSFDCLSYHYCDHQCNRGHYRWWRWQDAIPRLRQHLHVIWFHVELLRKDRYWPPCRGTVMDTSLRYAYSLHTIRY